MSVDVNRHVPFLPPAHIHLLAALQSLPPKWRGVLWYVDVLQEPHGSVGLLMEMDADDVPTLVNRARAALRKEYMHARPHRNLNSAAPSARTMTGTCWACRSAVGIQPRPGDTRISMP